MAWPEQIFQVRDELNKYDRLPWHTAPEIARIMGWPKGRTYYWLDFMVKNYWITWRWHPNRHGWHATRQYGLPWLTKGR